MFKCIYLIIFATLICSCNTLSSVNTQPSNSRSQIHLGTKVEVIGIDNLSDSNLIFKKISQVDDLLSTYKPNSPVTRLNRGEEVLLQKELKKYIVLSLKLRKKTLNYFDFTIGTLTKKFKKHSNYTVNSGSLKKTTFPNISINNKLKLTKNLKLDFGGIGKGFAIWEAVSAISDNDSHYIIKASGDIYCNKICNFHVEPPTKKLKKMNFKTCNNKQSISTSGNYRNFIKTKKNNHLINPKTGQSQSSTASLTVVSSGPSYEADALATALSVAPNQLQRSKILKAFDASYLHISNDGVLEYGANFKKYFCI